MTFHFIFSSDRKNIHKQLQSKRRDRRAYQNAHVKEMLTVRKEYKDYDHVFVSILSHAINFSRDVFNPVKFDGFMSSMKRERKCFQTELREAIGSTASVTVDKLTLS